MKVHLQLLRDEDRLADTLESDGWRLVVAQNDMLLAQHPRVKDERSARERLHRLGLLTSACLRIDFEQPRKPDRLGTALKVQRTGTSQVNQ